MSFFDDLPVPPKRPRQPRHEPPVWAAPPSDELPVVFSVGEFLHRSPELVMAVKGVEVFSRGCLIEVVWSIRRGSQNDLEWQRIVDQCFNRGGYLLDAAARGAGVLQFGVAFPDGRKATTAQMSPGTFDGTESVTGPVMMMTGGGGGVGSDEEVSSSNRFWLWPLPLQGDLRVVAQWDDLGMKETSVVIRGQQLARAAAGVQRYWDKPIVPET